MAILVAHGLLGLTPVNRTAGSAEMMRTDLTYRVGTVQNLHNLLGILGQAPVNHREVMDKRGAVSLAPKALQAKKRVGSQPNHRLPLFGGTLNSIHSLPRQSKAESRKLSVFLTKKQTSASFENSLIILEGCVGSRLLVINSSPAIRRLLEKAAAGEGYEVAAFTDGPSALEEAGRVKPEMIIADYQLDGLPCADFCDKLNEMGLLPNTVLILLVNPSDQYDENGMRSRGVKAFLPKPFRPEQISRLIQQFRTAEAEVKLQITLPGASTAPESTATFEPSRPAEGGEDDPAPVPALRLTKEPVMPEADTPSPNGLTQDLGAAMGPVLSLLVQTVCERANAGLAQTVNQVVAQQLAPQVRGMVQQEVSAQIVAAMSGEALLKAIQEAVEQHLPTMTAQLTSTIEQTLRQDLSEKTGEAVNEIVRDVANQKVEESLSTTVPDIAEAQIKKEIERLTAAP